MIDSLYVGLTGLNSFASGLKTISNNVANMNTVGYKARQSQFSDLYYQYKLGGNSNDNASSYTSGNGVKNGNDYINAKQGELRSTGNDLDAAIDGRGYFMLQDDRGEVYTRSGQFDIAADGYLVARGTDRRVFFINDNGNLQPVNINEKLSNPAKATQKIIFGNTLNDTSTTAYSTNVTAYDSLGKSHTLAVKFTKFVPADGDTRTWQMDISENGTSLVNREIRFASNGSPASGFENISFDYQPSTNVDKVTLNFDLTNTSISAAASNVAATSQDGYGAGALLKTTFDTDGTVIFSYSNDQKIKGPRLALAYFNFDSGLEAIGENLFVNSNGQERTVGRAGEEGLGKITGGSIEASNVDLADQFSELIIVQRGYQASSQVITTANEMIQQLFDMKGKR